MATTPTLMDRLKTAIKPLTDKFYFDDYKTTGPGLAAIQQNLNEYQKGTASPQPTLSPVQTAPFPSDLVNPTAHYGSRPGEKRLNLDGLGGIGK